MKVSEYHKKGLRNFVEEKPKNFQILGSAKEGIHRVECYVQIENNKIIDAKFNASKRCKKLLAVADIICEKLKNQEIDKIDINPDEILEIFNEEKDKEKMRNRINIVLKALENRKEVD